MKTTREDSRNLTDRPAVRQRAAGAGSRENEGKLVGVDITKEHGLTLSLLKGLKEGIALVNREGKQILVNDELCKMTGFSEEELLAQKPPFKYWAEEGLKEINDAFEKTLKGVEGEYELIFKRKNGERFTALVSPRKAVDGDGNDYFFATVKDITERKRVDEQIRQAAKEWEATFDSITEPVSIHDKDFRLLRVNKAFADAFNKTPQELVGQHCYKLVHGTDEPVPTCPHLKTQETKEPTVAEFFEPHLGLHLEVSTSPMFDDNGEVMACVHVARDITERKRTEEALMESEERYRSLIELGGQIGEAVVMVQDSEQGEGIQIFVSDEWPRITGYSKEELLGMSFFDLVSPEYREASMDRHRQKLAGEDTPGLFEMSIIRKDGSELPVELTSAYTTYQGKRANVAFIRKVDERKRNEEQIIRTQRLASIGELVSGVAHEINNPLTGIIGFAELVLEKNVPDDIKEDIAIIHHEAKRAAGVIENLLTFARKHKPKKQLININSIVARVLRLRAYEHKVSNIQVTTHFATNLPAVMADASQLQQVFLNIIINAEHAMADTGGKNLIIGTRRIGDTIQLTFTDDGPGISPENMSHIFDPFFTTKELGKGTGLGLSVCHGMITEHGGRIYAESKPGKGATFVVELPMVTIDVEGGMGDENLG